MLNNTSAIVLAAGKGTRMGTRIPKVLRKLGDKPLVSHIISTLKSLPLEDVVVVVGHKHEKVRAAILDKVNFALQEELLGTGSAVKVGLSQVKNSSDLVIVLNSDDSMLIKPKTIKDILNSHKNSKLKMTIVTAIKPDYNYLGILKRDSQENIIGLSVAQNNESEIATGIYVFDKDWLKKALEMMKKGKNGEYGLPQLLNFALEQKSLNSYIIEDPNEWMGANTPLELRRLRNFYKRINK